LHEQNIIYRDLKPDNVLIGGDGHVMLTDFGLSRENVKRSEHGAKSFCGSYAYLAPEMIKKKGHGKTVDWYLLGVVLYELLTGLPPYYVDDKEELFENILKSEFKIDTVKYKISEDCDDLLRKLLEKDPIKRLGHNGALEIKSHRFFKETDWEKVLKK
jgi:serine/threonine protein kinase